MTREFVITAEFDNVWKSLGLTDNDLRKLQLLLCAAPDYGDVMRGTGGVRKMRVSALGKGKSGGVRVLYLDVPQISRIYLLTAFAKKCKANLSAAERNTVKTLVTAIKNAGGQHGC